MTDALSYLQALPNVSEAAKVTTYRTIYRGVEVTVLVLDHGHGATHRYSVASFATFQMMNNQGGDGADWRLQGPASTVEDALALIDWSRFDVRIPDLAVYQSRPTILPGATEPTRPHARVKRVEVFDEMTQAIRVEAHDLDNGGRVVFGGTAEEFDRQYELLPPE